MLIYKLLSRAFSERSGAVAIEYCLMVTLIAIACITAFEFVGTNISATFSAIAMNL